MLQVERLDDALCYDGFIATMGDGLDGVSEDLIGHVGVVRCGVRKSNMVSFGEALEKF